MKKILLVDDDQICNLISKKTLQRMGIVNEVHTALNGEEAITLLNDYFKGALSLPDVILLDLNMPIMDGFSFIEAFNRLKIPNKESMRIVIVTSSQNPNDISKARELGVTSFLTKPVTETNLRSAFEELIS
ncbi:response regulator [Ohtaekwangia koreensis]|uniref:Response regulator receiver domain-containing protein n=1 Tax=Ohtaekwangia koreensis TaxID=688867 RepID=A0A1T5M8G4_9BACT|nr:response regulator [Ohtaekwangia koreensis]SKC84139.1 Response regulator receiver domain-containing protein [Ohtaekwangia koreensis]